LKHLKKTLFSLEASEEKKTQASPIETHEEVPTNPKKNRGQPFGSKNNKKNLATNNVV
jgi:hypothetical protein